MNRMKVLLSNNSFVMFLPVFIMVMQFAPAMTRSFENLQFNQWCMDYRSENLFGFCNENCDKGVNGQGDCELVLPFDFDSMSERQRMYACDYYSPFGVKNATRESTAGDITCTYQPSTYCKSPEDKQIGNQCYQVSQLSTYNDVKCSDGYQMMKGNSQKENRWATIILQLGVNSIWINGTETINVKNNAMIIKLNGFEGHEHGMQVRFPEDELRLAVCQTPAIRIPIEQFSTGELEFMVTNNVVQPDGTPDKPNIKKYHEYCDKVFPGSIAAYPDHVKLYLKERDTNNKIVHVAGQLNPAATLVTMSDCAKSQKTNVVRPMHGTFDSTGKIMGIAESSWVDPKFPNNKCSDTVRSVLTIHKNKIHNGLVDEPATARHKLLCVRGNNLTPASAADFCGERAEQDAGPYDCKCKEGFRDASNLTVEEFANKNLYKKGQLCFPSSCTKSPLSVHVIMLIDLSGSEVGIEIQRSRDYFLAMPDLIPKNAVINLLAWGNKIYHNKEYHADNEAHIEKLKREIKNVKAFAWEENGAATETLKTAVDLFKKHNKQVKIMITVTDGDSGNRDAEYIRAGQEVVKNGIHVVVVQNGDDQKAGWQRKWEHTLKAMINPSEVHTNYMRVHRKGPAATKLQFNTVFSTKCTMDID